MLILKLGWKILLISEIEKQKKMFVLDAGEINTLFKLSVDDQWCCKISFLPFTSQQSDSSKNRYLSNLKCSLSPTLTSINQGGSQGYSVSEIYWTNGLVQLGSKENITGKWWKEGSALLEIYAILFFVRLIFSAHDKENHHHCWSDSSGLMEG